MWTSACVKGFIHRLKDGDIFTTRDVIGCGKRSAVDQALKRCVADEIITRIARGVFMRDYMRRFRNVSAEEVARIKAQSFRKSFLVDNNTFRVDGRASSFAFGDTRIQLQEIRRKQRTENTDGGSR
jgi:hypothetical protein